MSVDLRCPECGEVNNDRERYSVRSRCCGNDKVEFIVNDTGNQELYLEYLTERFYAVREQRDRLLNQVNKLIESCYYRTKNGYVHWKQGTSFGTSYLPNTDPKAFEQAIKAIRLNAGIDEEVIPEDE